MDGRESCASLVAAGRNRIGGFPAVGHGLGLSWESPWMSEADTTVVQAGMYLAAELFAGHESIGGALFEHNGLVTEDGFEVLTTTRERWW